MNQKERTLHVEIHYLIPTNFGNLTKRRRPSRSSVVDQHIEMGFSLVEFCNQFGQTLSGRYIARQCDTVSKLTECLRRLQTRRRFSGRDVHALGARLQKTLRHKSTEATGASRYQTDFALHRKKTFDHLHTSPYHFSEPNLARQAQPLRRCYQLGV